MTGITSACDGASAHGEHILDSLMASTSSWFPTARALSNDSLMMLPTQSDLKGGPVRDERKACEEEVKGNKVRFSCE